MVPVVLRMEGSAPSGGLLLSVDECLQATVVAGDFLAITATTHLGHAPTLQGRGDVVSSRAATWLSLTPVDPEHAGV